MGAVAGPHLIVLMLTAMEHDFQARLNSKMDTQMLMSMRSIFFGNQKAQLYSQLQSCSSDSPAYKSIMCKIQQIESRERMIQSMEKTLEMQMKQLENQLKMVQQRKEAAQKMLDRNIQNAFTYGHGGR